jgi:general secretion pathway protein L
MADFLVIRLGADRDRSAEWLVVDGNGTRKGAVGSGSLSDAADQARDKDVIVLVPSASVLTTAVSVPIRGGSRLRAALPFALEEHVAEDVESLHFAAGPRRESGLVPVAVVAHDVMTDWLERLAEAGITAASLVPENCGLARIPGTLSLLVADDQVMFNDGADSEFVMQGVKPSDALAVAGVLDDSAGDALANDNEPPARHLLAYCDAASEERFQHDWIALRHELAGVDLNLLPDGPLPRLAVTVAAGRGINLLQGRYAPKTDMGAMVRPWRLAAMLLLGLVIVGVGGKAIDTWRLGQEAAALKTQFTQEYRKIQPADTREVLDPVATVNSLRRSVGAPAASTVFLPSLQELGEALSQNSGAEIEAISYRAGVIDVRLTAPDVATLDNIQRLVSRSGRFNASIQSTDQVGDKVSSRIQIREAGA